uniref:Uncharacterized protein n=1 Tax=Pithovirus LCPAC302 TaxID=2506593 RepID=A0A481Z8C1_9VIRU|nr:MAG: hypothetical protein LCPAC302_00100 [Pithovirus LCPAC302]
MCTGHDPNEACSWPKKTVRAAIALICIPMIIGFSCVIMVLLFTKGQYESALGILASLTGIAGTIVGYYFGSRSAESAADKIITMEHEILESRNKEILSRTLPTSYQNADLREVVEQ